MSGRRGTHAGGCLLAIALSVALWAAMFGLAHLASGGSWPP